MKLPRPKLAHYYWPAYEPARVELVKGGVDATSHIVLDGRESMTIDARPLTDGAAGGPLTFPFFALAFQRDDPFFPSQVKLKVTMPDGTAKTLNLAFPATVIDFENPDDPTTVGKPTIAAQLDALEGYLDGVMKAAEVAAGIGARLFAAPKAVRIPQIGGGFGRLLVMFNAADTTGNKLSITGATSTHPGGDPMGLAAPLLGTIRADKTNALGRYLENAALLAQEAATFGYNDRRLENPTCAFDPGTKNLTTTIAISDRYGGPGAEVKLTASSGLETLFDSATSKPNSATTQNNAKALRDRSDLYRDAFSAAIQRLRDAGKPTDTLKDFGCVMIMPVEPAAPDPTKPSAVLPSEVWNVSPLDRPFGFRGAENITMVEDRKDEKIQLQSAWTLVFMPGGFPDNPTICHELGHALGYGDLYKQDGYRDELAYMADPLVNDKVSWAMMDWHPPMSHHCGYHKLQTGWIPDGDGTEEKYGRVYPLGLPKPPDPTDPAGTRTWDLLLVPIELWRDSIVASSRAAFGVDDMFPVAQLAYIDLGGDGSVFGLIEARQPGARFSKNLPGNGGIVITNCITWTTDERFALAGRFRRSVQLLNPGNILRNSGEVFDLAFAPELAVKGLKAELVDRKVVEGDAQVFRVKVTRENAEFADVYMETGDPYWKSPDVWVDWMGNNLPPDRKVFSDKVEDHQNYGPGLPTDQGEGIRVHPAGATTPDGKPKNELHWLIGRIRNKGTIKAIDVKINFYYFEPPGGGDGGKAMNILDFSRYKLIGSTIEQILGREDPDYRPKDVLMKWPVPPGFGGHTCLYVHIEDSKVPEDSSGAVLGTADIWSRNNAAQKNVDKFEAPGGSPFAPIEFDFSVHNAGPVPEHAYIEPDGLPHGMQLTVTPPSQQISSGKTAIFHCELKLDEHVIRTGCENDQRSRIHAWRQDSESSARWGGVEYEIRPREKTETNLGGTWDSANQVTLSGAVTPAPGGGLVRIRLDFANEQATWISVDAAPTGKFTWVGHAPSSSRTLEAVAWFEGNRKFGSSRSNSTKVTAPPPPVIH